MLLLFANQYIGNACENFNGVQIGTDAYYSGTGYWTGEGLFTGYGLFSGSGYLQGRSYFELYDGNFSGYVPGFQPQGFDILGNGLPRITYSGLGFTGDSISQVFGSNTLYGRNNFLSSGTIYNDIISSGLHTGNGFFIGSGFFIVSGRVVNFGTIAGHGTISGEGRISKFPEPLTVPACSGCFANRIYMSGWGDWTGIYSGQGFAHSTSTGNGILSGNGSYYLQGQFTGFSSGFYYGFGFFSGGSLQHSTSGGFFIPQSFYGTGHWTGNGWIRADDGHYSGRGSGTTNGTIYGQGYSTWSSDQINLVSGSGCWAGYGEFLLYGPGGSVTGLYCKTIDADILNETEGCGSFPTSFMTDCSQIGNITLQFGFTGDCEVKGRLHG